jgi:hypothetical protein
MWRTLIAMGVITLCNSLSVAAERNDSSRKQYAAVTRLRVAAPPETVCAGACETTADGERAKLAPSPAWPLYRPSPTQAEAARQQLLKQATKNRGVEPFTRNEAIKIWVSSYPKGAFNPDDLADVFAKYWIFSWICSGIDPHAVTEAAAAGVRAQAHILLAADPVVSALSESQRQTLAETTIRTQAAGFAALMIASDANHKKFVIEMLNRLKTRFETQFGLELGKLALTEDQGFVMQVP